MYRSLKNIFWICLLICSGVSFSQEKKVTDSLGVIVKSSAHDTTRINALLELSLIYRVTNFDSSLRYGKEAYELSKKINFKNGECRSYTSLGHLYSKKGDFPLALEYHQKALQLRDPADKKGQALSYDNIGNIYRAQGNYSKALELLLAGLKLRETLGKHKALANSYTNIGTVYKNLGKLQEALDYHFKALPIMTEYKDLNGMASVSSNLGLTYWVKQDNAAALEYLGKAEKIWREENRHPENLRAVYNNMGLVYFDQKDYANALAQHNKALVIDEKIRDKYGLSITYSNIGNNLEKLGKFDEAIRYQEKALDLAQQISGKENLKYAYIGLASAYNSKAKVSKNFSDLENSLKYYKLYLVMHDSILNEESSRQIAEMAAKYEFEKKEARIALLSKERALKDAELARSRAEKVTQQNIFIGLFLFLLLFGFVLFFFIRIKRASEKTKMEKQLLELEHQALRLQMNPHFIFNSLNSIGNFIGKNETSSAKKFLVKFSKLMRLILENSREGYVSLQSEMDILLFYLELEQLRFNNRFTFSILTEGEIAPEMLQIPPMLMQPFVENAILHGVAALEKEGRIEISFRQRGNKLECEVKDNGVGRKKSAEIRKNAGVNQRSMAMTVMQQRLNILADKIQGRTEIKIEDLKDDEENPSGTKITVEIPIKTM